MLLLVFLSLSSTLQIQWGLHTPWILHEGLPFDGPLPKAMLQSPGLSVGSGVHLIEVSEGRRGERTCGSTGLSIGGVRAG